MLEGQQSKGKEERSSSWPPGVPGMLRNATGEVTGGTTGCLGAMSCHCSVSSNQFIKKTRLGCHTELQISDRQRECACLFTTVIKKDIAN